MTELNWTAIAASPWVGFAGTVLGVVGLLASVFFYFRPPKIQRPATYKSTIRWFDGQHIPHRDIELRFRGQVVDKFVITHIAFWNAGKATIRSSDFAATSPLRLRVPLNVDILDVSLTGVTTEENGVRLCPLQPHEPFAEAVVDFAYFDHNDGFSVQVIHTGAPTNDIAFVGKLPGVKSFSQQSEFRVTRTLTSRIYLRNAFQYKSIWYRLMVLLYLLSIGVAGIWMLYLAAFSEFHWYHLFGLPLALVGLSAPFAILDDVSPPKALCDAVVGDHYGDVHQG
jgi:hypothetical protein